MRAILQRVKSASVTVDGEVVSEISRGLLCFIGLKTTDTEKDMDYIVKKITKLRLWPKISEETGAEVPWQQSVTDLEGEVLCVSQFTLYGVTNKGNKPDFHQAMPAGQAREAYDKFLTKLRAVYPRVKDGRFQAMMDVALVNDGPITLHLESPLATTGSK